MSRPFGRKPYGRAAAARSGRPGVRRSAVPAVTLHRWPRLQKGPNPSSVPGILSPGKITVKGAPCARVLRMAQAPLLTVIFPGKTIGTYRLDGAVRAHRPRSEEGVCR